MMLNPLEVIQSYRPHDYSLADLFDSRSIDPNKEFAVFKGQSWSYAQFKKDYLTCAQYLVSRGIKPGDRVGLIAKNNIGHLLVLFACARIGAIMVPANPELRAEDAAYIFSHAGVSAVCCDLNLLPVVREACQGIDPAPWYMSFAGSESDAVDLLEILQQTFTDPLPPPSSADATCLIIFTSGTTGFPKGAMHSQRNFITSGEANISRLWLQTDERVLTVLPLFHINALFYSLAGTIAAGATIIIVERFSASTFWDTAAETRATQVNFIDTVGLILKSRPRSEFNPNHQIRIIYGLRPEEEAFFQETFKVSDLINGIGMTEIPGIICNPYDGERKFGSLGPVGRHPDPNKPWAQCRLVDDDGVDVATDEVGELWVKHPIVMQGYYKNPEQTEAAFEGEWYKTGDLMRRDSDGYFYFVSRKKDLIRRRGENIAGAEIDKAVASHPSVKEVAAVGVPSELGGEEILVAIVTHPNAKLDAAEVVSWCAERLAKIKIPRYVLFVDDLPHTPTYKVAKNVLKSDPNLMQQAIDTEA
ncbi:AMP-binding protein [Polynucleobacter sp. Latsch14-2]|jgi:crotonobetaine/carnitine-CoA ligase|uniref:class I adenylate-forming enzyme family protein n=1 Tax=Polynucleobacter sp. Latsch14-2 TaxID=2576920 RepID=UPI001C0C703B|nr:AMP-binding protein [Polynucleobacter sp. Latsch14-2]MBU3614241.1 AMP-binding protein [Polynucleobacter sp. Latsch14-2]